MRRLLLAAALTLTLVSCEKQLLQTTYDKQTTTIESFVSARLKADETATLTRTGGAYRVTMNDTLDPARDSLNYGGTVTFDYALYTLSGSSVSASNLVATSNADIASAAGWTLSDESQFGPVTKTLDSNMLEGLRDGLFGVQPDDEAYILFTGKYAYGKTQQGAIPSLSGLVYHVWIKSISNE